MIEVKLSIIFNLINCILLILSVSINAVRLLGINSSYYFGRHFLIYC